MTQQETNMKNDYLKMKGRSGFHFATHLLPAVGVLGFLLFWVGLYQGLYTPKGDFNSAFTGVFLSLLLLPMLFQTGMELDSENSRFREFEGFLGRSKDPWIEVLETDYLSIVGFTETQAGSGRRPSATVTVGMSKVYFWIGDWHLELFKGEYEQALKFAEKFAAVYGIASNDVNKDQEVEGYSQGSF